MSLSSSEAMELILGRAEWREPSLSRLADLSIETDNGPAGECEPEGGRRPSVASRREAAVFETRVALGMVSTALSCLSDGAGFLHGAGASSSDSDRTTRALRRFRLGCTVVVLGPSSDTGNFSMGVPLRRPSCSPFCRTLWAAGIFELTGLLAVCGDSDTLVFFENEGNLRLKDGNPPLDVAGGIGTSAGEAATPSASWGDRFFSSSPSAGMVGVKTAVAGEVPAVEAVSTTEEGAVGGTDATPGALAHRETSPFIRDACDISGRQERELASGEDWSFGSAMGGAEASSTSSVQVQPS